MKSVHARLHLYCSIKKEPYACASSVRFIDHKRTWPYHAVAKLEQDLLFALDFPKAEFIDKTGASYYDGNHAASKLSWSRRAFVCLKLRPAKYVRLVL